jgi:hypothetical protein
VVMPSFCCSGFSARLRVGLIRQPRLSSNPVLVGKVFAVAVVSAGWCGGAQRPPPDAERSAACPPVRAIRVRFFLGCTVIYSCFT